MLIYLVQIEFSTMYNHTLHAHLLFLLCGVFININ